MQIGAHEIGPASPVFVVAELGGNHHKDIDLLYELIYAAKAAGADAVKGQAFHPDRMTLRGDWPSHTLTWAGRETTLHDLYSETAMPMHWHEHALGLCRELGMEYFASVFSQVDCDYLDSLGVPAYKIASFELTDLPLIRHVASKGKPVILSTGMASYVEIANAWLACPPEVIALKCTSSYPAPISDANINTLPNIAAVWQGLSDHTRNNSVVCAAVALGACMVERHFTLSRAAGGPDAAFSDEPHEFAAMVQAIRDTTAALGTVHYGPTDSERPMLRFRRSLWVTADIAAGEPFTAQNVASLRPEGGLPPGELPRVLGTVAKRGYKRGEPLLP